MNSAHRQSSEINYCCDSVKFIIKLMRPLIFRGAKLSWLATFEIFTELTFPDLSFSFHLPNSGPTFHSAQISCSSTHPREMQKLSSLKV